MVGKIGNSPGFRSSRSWLPARRIGENRSWALTRRRRSRDSTGGTRVDSGDDRFCSGLVYFFDDITLKLTVNRRVRSHAAVGAAATLVWSDIWCFDLRCRRVPRLDAGRRVRRRTRDQIAGHTLLQYRRRYLADRRSVPADAAPIRTAEATGGRETMPNGTSTTTVGHNNQTGFANSSHQIVHELRRRWAVIRRICSSTVVTTSTTGSRRGKRWPSHQPPATRLNARRRTNSPQQLAAIAVVVAFVAVRRPARLPQPRRDSVRVRRARTDCNGFARWRQFVVHAARDAQPHPSRCCRTRGGHDPTAAPQLTVRGGPQRSSSHVRSATATPHK